VVSTRHLVSRVLQVVTAVELDYLPQMACVMEDITVVAEPISVLPALCKMEVVAVIEGPTVLKDHHHLYLVQEVVIVQQMVSVLHQVCVMLATTVY